MKKKHQFLIDALFGRIETVAAMRDEHRRQYNVCETTQRGWKSCCESQGDLANERQEANVAAKAEIARLVRELDAIRHENVDLFNAKNFAENNLKDARDQLDDLQKATESLLRERDHAVKEHEAIAAKLQRFTGKDG